MAVNSRQGSCRIIGGKWRGRKIKFNDAEGLRPTMDRVRETVFNWLQVYVTGSRCLDCFAGSGVLGFEALSRGADEVVFLEKNGKTAKSISDNIFMLGTDRAKVQHVDTLDWLVSVSVKNQFDIVFLDPPFSSDLLAKCCLALVRSGCLTDDAIIYIEHAADAEVAIPAGWTCLKQKTAGQTSYKLYENG